ncbi:acyclic terpene utilization AtuA family protein, partial [Xanthomonas vesicatoria]|uniref:acyclic terpene utilization AtuA family protein n=1 Tax=Xanthomonas vesicatoria TaxID=56460 RepID=UPI000F8E247B
TQATGGNFSGFTELDLTRPLGFPIAEIDADGSSVITKHGAGEEGETGGAVTVDTVTAQLVYEIQGTAYLNPDVVAHLDTVELAPDGDDRVRISGVRGSAPPSTTKVCLNLLGGFRNGVELLLTGLDIEAK